MNHLPKKSVKLLAGALLLALTAAAAPPQKFEFKVPLGLPADLRQELIPADNPMTAAKVALMKSFTSDDSRRRAQSAKPQTRAPFSP